MKRLLLLALTVGLLLPVAAKAHRDESKHVCALYTVGELTPEQALKRLEIKSKSNRPLSEKRYAVYEYCQRYILGNEQF